MGARGTPGTRVRSRARPAQGRDLFAIDKDHRHIAQFLERIVSAHFQGHRIGEGHAAVAVHNDAFRNAQTLSHGQSGGLAGQADDEAGVPAVVEHGRLVAIVSIRDLYAAVTGKLEEDIMALSGSVV